MPEVIARRQFDPLYIWLDTAFLVLFAALLLFRKKYMTVIVGLVFGVIYMIVDYGIFHLLCHSREIFNGYSLFWVLLWMSMSYGFTNFAWIWLWISKDRNLFEWSLLILAWWLCCPMLAETFSYGAPPVIIQRTTGAYHGYMALILFVGYLGAIVWNITRKEREEVSRMESLLGVFSQLTRLESGMIQIRPENSSLKKTISEAVGSIYMKAFEKGIDISLEEFPDVTIPHDPRWTAEVILNILDNAVKYSPSGTAVSIRVSALASYMMVEISDQGIGIPASDIQNIFKRFYRGSAPEIKSADGSGVGLYLARRILEEQGGTICVKTGTDGGSTFALTLPK